MELLKRLQLHSQQKTNAPAFSDLTHQDAITYGALEALTGRVYAYLTAKCIEQNDVVMICLPRDYTPLVTAIGVLKAGAAFVIVEEDHPAERIAFIKKDSQAKLTIDRTVWSEILNYPAKEGYAEVNEHSAAYIVYTSGTTGTPKGAIHEYGNIDRIVESFGEDILEKIRSGSQRFAMISPLSFVVTIMFLFPHLYIGAEIYVVPYAVSKNPLRWKKFLIEKQISGAFLSPSLMKAIDSDTPYLKYMFIAGEPARGIKPHTFEIYNIYAMSESAFCVCIYNVREFMEVVPIGVPKFQLGIKLLDEDGRETDRGELCFENPFVRGYINHSDGKVKPFGNGLYQSGDLAQRLSDGNYVIIGRLNDMFKINGNRVEPAEIEAAAMKVLQLKWAAAKAVSIHGKTSICLYYTDDVCISAKDARMALSEYLPSYMLPAYYMHIDRIPISERGKFLRRELPDPAYQREEYIAPRNHLERFVCETFEEILKISDVSINDDLFDLGADSLTAISLMAALNDPGISISDIFRCRTPKKIALLLQPKPAIHGFEEDRWLLQSYPLYACQRFYLDYQLYSPHSTVGNIPAMLKFRKDKVTIPKLLCAIKSVIEAHPALSTSYYVGEDGSILQHYTPELQEAVTIIETTEEMLRNEVMKHILPFKLIGSSLFRAKLFVTESNICLFTDIHHSISDGASQKVFVADLLAAIRGEEIKHDFYYRYLNEMTNRRQQLQLEAHRMFDGMYSYDDYSSLPKPDHNLFTFKALNNIQDSGLKQQTIDAAASRLGISENVAFIAASMLALRAYNQTEKVLVNWMFNGRTSIDMQNMMGIFISPLPVGIMLHGDMTIESLFSEIKAQVNRCIPFSELALGIESNSPVERDRLTVIWEHGIRMEELLPDWIEYSTFMDDRDGTSNSFNVVVYEQNDADANAKIIYCGNDSLYTKESFSSFSSLITRIFKEIITDKGILKKALNTFTIG